MKKIIAFLISALFVSAVFAEVPVEEKSISTGSESLVNGQGLNTNSDEETAADEVPGAAAVSGAQDADD